MDIYSKIKALSDLENLSIADLEKQCSLGNGAIIKWKTSMPKADSLSKVATVFKMPIEYFLTTEAMELPNPHFAEESELLQNYRKLDNRRKHKLHLFIYDELESMKSEGTPAPRLIPFAASGEADITTEDFYSFQEELQKFDKRAKDIEGR